MRQRGFSSRRSFDRRIDYRRCSHWRAGLTRRYRHLRAIVELMMGVFFCIEGVEVDRVIERRDVEKGASVGWKERGGMEGEKGHRA